ncbi:MAG: transcription antitermination factor NusB [Candidatus Neomarinimicrobiota bacterium]|nr:transcription antitermination factor NusB [Candidatus Neomarinimicrobiota bacterium]
MTTINYHPRRKAREAVLKALYAREISEDSPKIIFQRFIDSFFNKRNNYQYAKDLFFCVVKYQDWVDALIRNHLQNWKFERVALIDRILLRMGISEILYMDDVPPKVSISEMVEIAKVFSTRDSSGFVNGILDSVFKEFQNEKIVKTKDVTC